MGLNNFFQMELNNAKKYFAEILNEEINGEEFDLIINSAKRIVYELAINCIESKTNKYYNVNDLSIVAQKISDLNRDFFYLNMKKSEECAQNWENDKNYYAECLENNLENGMITSQYAREKKDLKDYFGSREDGVPDFSGQIKGLSLMLEREKSSFKEKLGHERIKAYVKYVDLIADLIDNYKFLIDIAFIHSKTLAQELFNSLCSNYNEVKIF